MIVLDVERGAKVGTKSRENENHKQLPYNW